MKATENKIIHFLEGQNKKFIIPVYQRNYDWKKEQCKQLFDDLIDISKNNRTHFLSSIVFISNENEDNREFLIIDGQQRIITISLLFLAIYKVIDNNIRKTLKTQVNKYQILDEYLRNRFTKQIKLKPIKDDEVAYLSLFKKRRRIYSRYKYNLKFFIFL